MVTCTRRRSETDGKRCIFLVSALLDCRKNDDDPAPCRDLGGRRGEVELGEPSHCAQAVAVNRTYPSKLEKVASYPGLEIIAKLATVLAVEPGELLRSRPSMTRRN